MANLSKCVGGLLHTKSIKISKKGKPSQFWKTWAWDGGVCVCGVSLYPVGNQRSHSLALGSLLLALCRPYKPLPREGEAEKGCVCCRNRGKIYLMLWRINIGHTSKILDCVAIVRILILDVCYSQSRVYLRAYSILYMPIRMLEGNYGLIAKKIAC